MRKQGQKKDDIVILRVRVTAELNAALEAAADRACRSKLRHARVLLGIALGLITEKSPLMTSDAQIRANLAKAKTRD
ncbi:hypothetical protein COMA2_30330 [Candidatus Nitrospira nitrificans]|uniref:Uncharacterized protein n=1 Tax=Candidatus Nitrospira nitrificans TaxID=1742973 RepID=A0A0S4LJW6_9BACT|nr:hypothetical protein COMA2_30330 [Candidatus Nitrospira nitrificans]